MNENIRTRLDQFKLSLSSMSVDHIVKRHMTFGDCYILGEDAYFSLKYEVAKNFNIHPSEVLMVGSGKLGFSIVQSKRYSPFRDTSDIDIAIISPALFDRVWKDVYDYGFSGGYWPKENRFKKYFFNVRYSPMSRQKFSENKVDR